MNSHPYFQSESAKQIEGLDQQNGVAESYYKDSATLRCMEYVGLVFIRWTETCPNEYQ